MISVPLGGEGTAQLGQRTAAGGVEDEVPAAHPVGHVLAGVVDDVVGADRADQVDLGRAGYPGHRTPWPAGPRTTPPRRPPDDQDALSRLDLANIAQPLESREPRDGDGRRLLKLRVAGLRASWSSGALVYSAKEPSHQPSLVAILVLSMMKGSWNSYWSSSSSRTVACAPMGGMVSDAGQPLDQQRDAV
jgi:hypothetical protein